MGHSPNILLLVAIIWQSPAWRGGGPVPAQKPVQSFRTFFYLWASQGLSVFGSNLTFFAINVWLVTTVFPNPEQKAALASTLSLLALSFAIPHLALAPVAGVWADRYNKKRIMLLMDVGNGCLAAVMALLVWTGHFHVPFLLLISALASVMSAFHNAAFDTAYALLVPEAQLPRANGMMQMLWSLSAVLSPAAAATLVAFGGAGLAIGLDALSFFIAALILLLLPVPGSARELAGGGDAEPVKRGAPSRPSLWAEIRVGMQFLFARRELLWLLGMFAVANLLLTPTSLYIPLLAKFQLAADWAVRGFQFEGALATLNTSMAIGGIIGGAFVSAWGGLKQRRVFGVLIPLILSGLAQVLFGWTTSLWAGTAALFLFALGTPIANAHSQAIWQSRTPKEKQGRVFAVRRVIAQVTAPVMTGVAGWLAGRFDPGVLLTIFGAMLSLWALGQCFNPKILAADPPTPAVSAEESIS
jgi:DHA3 family macrolide efflux protein-like MFS transporter